MGKALTILKPDSITKTLGADRLVGRWLASLDISPRSRVQYEAAVKLFLPTMLNASGSPTRADVIAWRDAMLQEGRKASTVSLRMAGLRSFFRWLESEKIYPNVCAGVRGPRADGAYVRGAMTPQELGAILGLMRTTTVQGARDFAMFNLMARTGIRSIEIERANCAELTTEQGHDVLWVTGKGREAADRYVVVNEKALSPILDYLRTRAIPAHRARGRKGYLKGCAAGGFKEHVRVLLREEPLFTSLSHRSFGHRLKTRTIRHLWRTYATEAGYDQFHVHCLRHTAATLALRRGATIDQVQEMLRHSKIDTTMRYAKVDRLAHPAELFLDF